MAVDTLKIGRDKKVTPVTEVSDSDLKWYANECKSEPLKRIARTEINRRSGGGSKSTAALPAPTQAMVRTQPTGSLAIEGNFRDPSKATMALKEAAEAYHLISPATMVGALPEGCSIALALVRIAPDDPHLYSVGGKLALDKTHLAMLGNAMGASTVFSRRTDDGSNPHYCSWTAKVRFRQFDGTMLAKQGSVEMDVREPHGAEYVDAVRKAEKANRDPVSQIGELRRFITRHAESKAMNRALAACGIRRSYTKVELERPFCVARVVFTGQSDDPVARAQFREGIMQSFLGSSEDAFGPADHGPVEQLTPPPPLHDYSEPPTYDAEGEDVPPEAQPAQQQSSQQSTPPATSQPAEDDRGIDPEKY